MTSDMAATPSRLRPCPPARTHQRLPRDSAPAATAFCPSRPLSVSGFPPPLAAPSRRPAYFSRFAARLRCEQFAGVGPGSYVGFHGNGDEAGQTERRLRRAVALPADAVAE